MKTVMFETWTQMMRVASIAPVASMTMRRMIEKQGDPSEMRNEKSG
jgi:hypothetical protein